jgi:hypothetical protein
MAGAAQKREFVDVQVSRREAARRAKNHMKTYEILMNSLCLPNRARFTIQRS